MKKYAIIVAGGEGKRMQSTVPKQFLPLAGKPVLYYTLQAFLAAEKDINIILVLPEKHIASGQEIIDAWFGYNNIQICIGGVTRFDSVKNGLALVKDESLIAIHDAVRCMITPELILACFAKAEVDGTAIPTIACTDSVRIVNDNNSNEFFPRAKVRLVQTPQVFHSKIIVPAYDIEYKEKFTDEASVVDAFGLQLSLVEGSTENLKITTPKDILLAEYLLRNRMQTADFNPDF